MKKISPIILLFITLSSYGQNTIDKNCSGLQTEHFKLLSYSEMQLYVSNYDRIHASSRTMHTKAYYINSRTIIFLKNFFKANPDFLGFNIYFVSYSTKVAKKQKSSSQSLLYLVPVRELGKTADYSALNNYFLSLPPNTFNKDSLNRGIPCYGNCDSSIMQWCYLPIPTTERLNSRPGGNINSDIFLLSTDRATHDNNRKKYTDSHGKELNKDQTKRVFFNKAVIYRIAAFLEDGNNIESFPLVGLYFASYNGIIVPRQKNKDQTTLGFTPMRATRSFFEPDPCSYIEFIKTHPQLHFSVAKSAMIENHGELCPDDCPPGGN